MATEAQKNFRKQMKQLQKEMAQKNQGEFFSYIENDHIEHYYKPKNRKKIVAISLGSILPLLWVGYSLYTWIKPLAVSVNPNAARINAVALNDNGIFDPTHEKIINYLQKVQVFENQIQSYLGQMNYDFNTILGNQTVKVSFIDKNTKLKKELETITLSLSGMSVPGEMAEYHAAIKAKYESIHEQTVYSIDIANTGNTSNISHLKYLSEKITLLQKQQTQQLTMVFDKVGIKYQQEGDRVTYWYHK